MAMGLVQQLHVNIKDPGSTFLFDYNQQGGLCSQAFSLKVIFAALSITSSCRKIRTGRKGIFLNRKFL